MPSRNTEEQLLSTDADNSKEETDIQKEDTFENYVQDDQTIETEEVPYETNIVNFNVVFLPGSSSVGCEITSVPGSIRSIVSKTTPHSTI